MIGLDTSFLVAFENSAHDLHDSARNLASQYAGEGFGLAPQVLSEFVHVVTDTRRFKRPLDVSGALDRALRWWNATEVRRVYPGDQSVPLFLEWMSRYDLGRKRVLDTQLAATYSASGVGLILTTDWRDFEIFPGLHPIVVGK